MVDNLVMLEEKDHVLSQLEQELQEESGRRDAAEKQLQRYMEQDKGRSKTRNKELEQENEELKKVLRQK